MRTAERERQGQIKKTTGKQNPVGIELDQLQEERKKKKM